MIIMLVHVLRLFGWVGGDEPIHLCQTFETHIHLSENKGGSSSNTLASTNDILNSYGNGHVSLSLEYRPYCYALRKVVTI